MKMVQISTYWHIFKIKVGWHGLYHVTAKTEKSKKNGERIIQCKKIFKWLFFINKVKNEMQPSAWNEHYKKI